MVLSSALFVAAAILVPGMSPVLRIATLLLFGGGGLLLVAVALSRKVALRVDQAGITLGGQPLRYESGTLRIPWAEVQAVVLWRQHSAAGIAWIGVLRSVDAPPLPSTPAGATGRRVHSAAAAISGAPDARLLECGRTINGWKLDTAQLAATLRAIAPQVELIDNR
ncbi:hypothetical protein AB0H76_32830 [Nocardia sp. NPDC050712]|uniref:hypothetical protein n=1 Tax=Nocardia sp. NPDC050712 TaxID=3155518 RepID=UPI0033DC5AF0